MNTMKQAVLALALAVAVCAAISFGPASVFGDETKRSKDYPLPDEFVEVEQTPVATSVPEPIYPEAARNEGIEGDVWVRVLVDTAGAVGGVIIEKRSGNNAGFEAAAMKAALDGEWQPAKVGGKPVACWVSYKVSFTLH